MKISYGKALITPVVGTPVAGYAPHDVSYAIQDDLYVNMLALDDGNGKAIILSYDLVGVDAAYIRRIRHDCAVIAGCDDSRVILSCTHTHTGPNSRWLSGHPEVFEREYMEKLVADTAALAKKVLNGEWREVSMYFCSDNCDANVNRRLVTRNNRCTFLPHRRDLEKMADGICDKEMGTLCFMDKSTGDPAYIIGNYAAHPLAGHAPGLGGHRISADYPGVFRKYVENETGAGCMFLSGAAGDMVPRGHETGVAAMNAVGTQLAQTAIDGVIIATRDAASYRIENATIQSGFEYVTRPVRVFRKKSMHTEYAGLDEITFEIQLFSIGDICLVGVPGELVAELGLEIKWHSPFKKAFVLYCSTGYMDYLCHGNALVSGGYEAHCQWCDSRTGLSLVNAAVDGMYKLYEQAHPNREEWPENVNLPLVSVHI